MLSFWDTGSLLTVEKRSFTEAWTPFASSFSLAGFPPKHWSGQSLFSLQCWEDHSPVWCGKDKMENVFHREGFWVKYFEYWTVKILFWLTPVLKLGSDQRALSAHVSVEAQPTLPSPFMASEHGAQAPAAISLCLHSSLFPVGREYISQ